METIDDDIKTIITVLIRQGLTNDEAVEELFEMRERVLEGESPSEILHEIGLEPDYMFSII